MKAFKHLSLLLILLLSSLTFTSCEEAQATVPTTTAQPVMIKVRPAFRGTDYKVYVWEHLSIWTIDADQAKMLQVGDTVTVKRLNNHNPQLCVIVKVGGYETSK